MPRPVVITTLQEDLKAIGLIEGDQEKLAPKADPEGGYAEDGGRDEPEDDPDTIKKEGRKGEGKVVKAGKPGGKKFEGRKAEGRKGESIPPEIKGEDDDEPEDDDKEGDLPPKAQEAIQAIRTLSRSFLRAHAPVGPKPVGSVAESKKPKSRLEQLAEGQIYRNGSTKPATDRVASLLEEVATVMGDIRRAQKEEQLKGFANIAMIAEHLSNKFRHWGMSLSEGGLFKVGRQMHKLAEDAAAVAQKIDDPTSVPEPEADKDEPKERAAETTIEQDDKSVDDLFKKFMSKLLDALQLYNDVQGKSERAAEGDEEDEPVDDEPEEMKDEGDDEDEPAPDSDDEPKSEYTDEADDDEEPADDDDEDDEEESKDEGDEEDEPEDDDEEESKDEGDDEDEPEDDDSDDDDEDESIDEAEGDDDDDEDDKEEDDDSPYGVPVKDKDGEMSVGEAREFLTRFRKSLTEAKKGKKSPKGGKAASPKGGKKAPPPLAKQLSKRGDVKNPEALAAWLGMKKLGVGKFQKRAAAARKGGKKGKK